MKFLKNLLVSTIFASLFALVATSANAKCKARLGDFDWSSANIHTAITTKNFTKTIYLTTQFDSGGPRWLRLRGLDKL